MGVYQKKHKLTEFSVHWVRERMDKLKSSQVAVRIPMHANKQTERESDIDNDNADKPTTTIIDGVDCGIIGDTKANVNAKANAKANANANAKAKANANATYKMQMENATYKMEMQMSIANCKCKMQMRICTHFFVCSCM